MLMTGPALVYQMNNQQTVAVADLRVVMPEGADTNWDGPLNSGNDWEPHYTGSTSQKNDYRKADDVVSLYIAYYPRQKQGEEVINVKNSINGNWKMQYAHAQNVQLSDNAFKEQLIENPQLKKRLVWYWYNIGGQVTSNKYEAKVLQLAAMIKNRPQSYVVAVSIDVKENIENAREVLRHFFSDMKVQLGKINVAMEKG
jgi:EpsI family protein